MRRRLKHATTIILEPAHRPGTDFITDIFEAEIDPSFEILVRFYNHLKAYEWNLGKFRWAIRVGDHNNRKVVEL